MPTWCRKVHLNGFDLEFHAVRRQASTYFSRAPRSTESIFFPVRRLGI